MFKRAVLAVAVVMLGVGAAAAAERPRRVVSFNLCADQLLVTLADPDQIAGLSPYAADPNLSVVAAPAQAYRRLDWSAEAIIAAAPDLVFIGPTARPTQAMLTAAGIAVIDLTLVSDLAGARAQARAFGARIGHPDRGEALALALERAEQELRAVALSPPRTALVLERGGYSAGSQSLIAAMLEVAGLTPPADAPRGYGGYVTLEQLVAQPPDILVLPGAPAVPTDQASLILTHPALTTRFTGPRRIDIPLRDTLCGGPALLEGLGFLRTEMMRLRRQQ